MARPYCPYVDGAKYISFFKLKTKITYVKVILLYCLDGLTVLYVSSVSKCRLCASVGRFEVGRGSSVHFDLY